MSLKRYDVIFTWGKFNELGNPTAVGVKRYGEWKKWIIIKTHLKRNELIGFIKNSVRDNLTKDDFELTPYDPKKDPSLLENIPALPEDWVGYRCMPVSHIDDQYEEIKEDINNWLNKHWKIFTKTAKPLPTTGVYGISKKVGANNIPYIYDLSSEQLEQLRKIYPGFEVINNDLILLKWDKEGFDKPVVVQTKLYADFWGPEDYMDSLKVGELLEPDTLNLNRFIINYSKANVGYFVVSKTPNGKYNLGKEYGPVGSEPLKSTNRFFSPTLTVPLPPVPAESHKKFPGKITVVHWDELKDYLEKYKKWFTYKMSTFTISNGTEYTKVDVYSTYTVRNKNPQVAHYVFETPSKNPYKNHTKEGFFIVNKETSPLPNQEISWLANPIKLQDTLKDEKLKTYIVEVDN